MKNHYGFTLIEMAIVLVIVTLIAGVGLSMANALRTNLGVSSTRMKHEAIKQALITFIARNQRLPCPAIETLAPGAVSYGVESGGTGSCGATAVAGRRRSTRSSPVDFFGTERCRCARRLEQPLQLLCGANCNG